jgi:beta-glucosidase
VELLAAHSLVSRVGEYDAALVAANGRADLLRDQLGFDGLVVSDYDSIGMLHKTYRIAPTPGHAAGQALDAGIDVELPGNATTSSLRPLIEDGTFPEEILDRAVTNVLEVKARLGLVPDIRPSRPAAAARGFDRTAADRQGREAAGASVTLLADDGTFPSPPAPRRSPWSGPPPTSFASTSAPTRQSPRPRW